MGGDWGYLTDEVLREEIELVGDLVVAATASPGRMAQDDVDSVLGCATSASEATDRGQPTTTGSGSKPLNPTVE
jgi:hypothetical protein